MTNKPTKDHEWRIIRIKGSPAAYVGHVRAADEKEAIRKAIQQFQITKARLDLDQGRLRKSGAALLFKMAS